MPGGGTGGGTGGFSGASFSSAGGHPGFMPSNAEDIFRMFMQSDERGGGFGTFCGAFGGGGNGFGASTSGFGGGGNGFGGSFGGSSARGQSTRYAIFSTNYPNLFSLFIEVLLHPINLLWWYQDLFQSPFKTYFMVVIRN